MDKVSQADKKSMIKKIEEDMEAYDIKLDQQRDDQKTLEHYCERYLPLKTQQMIQENLFSILTPEQIEKLQGHENAMVERMQKQIMDFSNFSDGTIFDEIIRINEEMSRKLKIKCDLRKDEIVADS